MENRVSYIRDLLEWCDQDELRTLRAIISGKIVSDAKKKSSAANGLKGGRPRKSNT